MQKEIVTIESSLSTDIILRDAIDDATRTIEEGYCEGTRKALDRDIHYLREWFKVNMLSFCDVRKEHIILYIMQHAEEMPEHIDNYLCGKGIKAKVGTHSIATIERKIASLSHYLNVRNLPNPCRDRDIHYLLRKLTEKHGESQSWGKAITLDVLNDMLTTCDNSLKGIRDKAILLFGFSTGGRRRSEISSASMENLSKQPDGNYVYNLKYSKTNHTSKDDFKPIAGRAAMALTHWLDRSKISDGAIFRGIYRTEMKLSPSPLSDKQISNIIKSRCELAGYDINIYTAHSLRSGFVTEAGKRGKPMGDVMAMTGHRSVQQVMKYYHSGNALNNSAAYLAG